MGHFGITYLGVLQIEATETEPTEGTEHFDPADIQNVQHVHVYGGVVGAVVSGSSNTANIAQQINPLPTEVATAFAKLREAASGLPDNEREEASDAIDGLEDEAKSDKPKSGRIRGYARTLNAYLLAYAPTIALLVEHVLSKAKQ
jgi:hypothetical protein